MEFDEERILRIEDSEDKLSDISFVSPYSDNKVKHQTSLQLNHLLEEIKKNVWGCDLILCFFVAALQSYRADRCLRPFPPMYINEEGKNFNALRNTCDSIPPLSAILNEPKKCSPDVHNLLMWLFLERGHPVLRRISFVSIVPSYRAFNKNRRHQCHPLHFSRHFLLKNNTPFPSKINNVFKPHFVFEVCYHEKIESLWQKRQAGRETILAYHGSAVDNFYSILKVGLQQHFSFEKEVLFGNGIYLSNELSVSAHYAPFGQTWANSALGNKHSVIAVCEIINDVDKVKCRDSKNKRRSVNKDSLGEIPEKYFVVTDSDMVRVKYLMVYREKTVFSVKSYIVEHLFLCLLVLYFVLIVVIGIFSNSSYMKSWRKFINFFSFK